MAHMLKAHLLGLATEPRRQRAGDRDRAIARAASADEREASHLAVLDRSCAGNWIAAAVAIDLHNAAYPRDLVALQAGHLMDFYRANARDLRDRIARVLPQWSRVDARAPDRARHVRLRPRGDRRLRPGRGRGRRAIDLEPLDCWAHHAVAHVMEMQGRAEDGIGWMIAREPLLVGRRQLLQGPQLVAPRALSPRPRPGRRGPAPLRRTDPGGRSTVALDLIDASALLWRLHLSGTTSGDRWEELARRWDQHADGRLYPFNDWHAVMAYLGAGRDAEVERVSSAPRAEQRREDTDAGWARRDRPPADRGLSRLLARRLPAVRRAPPSRAVHRQPVRRQPRPARHHRLDADRGGAARRAHRPGRGARPRAPGAQAPQPGQPDLPRARANPSALSAARVGSPEDDCRQSGLRVLAPIA